ncbi:MAG TPA: polysulfide reductase, partial [Candidatus Dormibacteraeota bacterium]|nr:polysulfide reductase [Candidatus Dormibacteraeota bacterium]
LACAVTAPRGARAARLLAVGGGLVEVAAFRAMEHGLGEHAVVYRTGRAGAAARAAEGLAVGGAAVLGLLGRRRWAAALGGGALLAGSLCLRLAVWRAGPASAALTGRR